MTAIWKWHQAAAPSASELLPPDQGLAALYNAHYRSLTQLASLLTASPRLAEDIVQDAFVALHTVWCQLRDDDDALLYLQQAVVRQARSCASPCSGNPAAQAESCMLTALRSFPAPQREALVLSYYAELPEARIAHVMGIRPGAVRSHLARGLSSLQAAGP